MNFISKDIRMAGYWGCLNPLVGAANTDVDGTNDNAANTNDSIDTGTDTISIRGAFVLIPPTIATPATKTCGDSVDITQLYYTDLSSMIKYRINGNSLEQITNNQTNALVEDIEDMQISYGADTDNPADATPNYYVPAGTAGLDMSKVVSVRIILSVVTHDDNLAAVARPNGDHKIGRTFTSTIALRNRLP
jgi:type IV pilus assembly protein PilW